MSDKKENHIIETWQQNAKPWIRAIENDEITSRIHCTNAAIIEAILSFESKSVLDIGCGEGWLCRQLHQHSIQTTGIDISAELIRQAKTHDKGDFYVSSYEDLLLTIEGKTFDIAVCNFSLLGEISVSQLFKQIPHCLNDNGVFIIQTLHPDNLPQGAQLNSWQTGSWDGFNNDFHQPCTLVLPFELMLGRLYSKISGLPRFN